MLLIASSHVLCYNRIYLINEKKMSILTENQALDIYRKYLANLKLDYNSQLRRPCREAIAKAMYKTHQAQKNSASQIIQSHIDDGKKVWFWSDQHFNHHNIIRYSSRPFDSVAHMNNTMLSNYHANVKQEDLVVFGGDIAFGEVAKIKHQLEALPGKKVLIIGNHDFEKNQLYFRDFGIFQATAMSAAFHWKVEGIVCNILLSHYPIDNEYLPENTLNVHGHIHQYQADKKNLNVSVEHTDYAPMDIKPVIEQMFAQYC